MDGGWLSLGGAIYRAPTVLINAKIKCMAKTLYIDFLNGCKLCNIAAPSHKSDHKLLRPGNPLKRLKTLNKCKE